MVKSELIRRISAKLPDLSYQDVEMAVNQILERMSTALCNKERIEIRGFGSWSVAIAMCAMHIIPNQVFAC